MDGSAAAQILRHAGFDQTASEPLTVSTATTGRSASEIEAATADFLASLDAYNRELNGATPSETALAADVVPRNVAYAVGEVVRMLRESEAERCAWQVETAWLAVLAGDIDDLKEHVILEEAAREA